jgi:ribosomal protein L11 methyltransferase
LDAYVLIEDFDEPALQSMLAEHFTDVKVLETQILENKNWNEEWEKNFDPIVVNNSLRVRAVFHEPDPTMDMEIVIQPKMSFGTGHHSTTQLMMEELLTMNFSDQRVVDAGCGTGILSFLVEKRGGTNILAYDIEDWAFENSLENATLNHCTRMEVKQGVIRTLEIPSFSVDILIANINRNILMDEMSEYARVLKQGGTLLLSGFYEGDIEVLTAVAHEQGIEFIASKQKDKWALMKCIKK